MALHLKSDASAMSEINVTPLVDVMLVLLVVFIVTAPLLTRAVRIDLPKTSATAAAAQTRHLNVSLDADGIAYVDKRALPLAEVESELRNAARQNRDLAVQVYADQKVAYGQVAQLMAQIQRAGVTKIALVTLPQ